MSKEFIASYQHRGDDWTLTFCADEMADAARKITSIRRSLRLDGELFVSIRLPWLRWNIVRKWFQR